MRGGVDALEQADADLGIDFRGAEFCMSEHGLDEPDVLRGHFDVAQAPMGLHVPLELMQEGNGADQRQILHVVAPAPGLVITEAELGGVGIDHRQGL